MPEVDGEDADQNGPDRRARADHLKRQELAGAGIDAEREAECFGQRKTHAGGQGPVDAAKGHEGQEQRHRMGKAGTKFGRTGQGGKPERV